jgi:putative SOS response-associated peptidase YedK
MCGRFLLKSPLVRLQQRFGFAERPNLQARYNVAPSQAVATVRQRPEGGRELAMLQWGLVPYWSRDAKSGYKCINARAETIATAPAFRESFKRRRCLVLADGFYEWQKLEGVKVKQPILIQMKSGEPFAFAGLWDQWNGPDGPLQTATIITTAANSVVASIHNRMPVILDPAVYDRWLDPSQPDGAKPLVPCPDEWIETIPVSTRVNSPKNDDAELIAPLCSVGTERTPAASPDQPLLI